MPSLDAWFAYSLAFIDGAPKARMDLRTNKYYKGLSPANLDYFEFHVDDQSLAHELYEFRKQFFNVNKLLEHMLVIKAITHDAYTEAIKLLEQKYQKGRVRQQKGISTPEALAKIRASNKRTAKSRGLQVASRWASTEGREKYLASLRDESVIRRRVETFKETIAKNHDEYLQAMRAPQRCLKISVAASEMWARKSPEEKQRMRPSPGRRVHVVNGVKMNLPESVIATWLSKNRICWEYEKPFHHNDVTYYPDFYIGQSNTVVQHYGDFWHANPSKYQASDILFEGYTAADKWASDREYERILRDTWNLKIVVVWENELMNNTAAVFERLTKELHVS
jgi:G:T-mismatch repair DNA endonuclease (very short patch repair protein)